MFCRCRNCQRTYDDQKSRSWWAGFCSQRCMKTKARACGYRPRQYRSEYDILKSAKQIGAVPVKQGDQ